MNQTLAPGSETSLVAPRVKPVEALPSYYPVLDGLRAFSVLFVIFEHISTIKSPLSHFHGYLGVDIFFVLSGFLITGLLLREERLTGTVDMAGFYIRRAFRILPLYWIVLSMYVLMLQPASRIDKWTQMKAALPFFLTFNNDIPLLLMPDRVGTIFGLSWTLGIEEKFYFFWPLICFFLLTTLRRRFFAGWFLYGSAILLAIFSFKMGRAYSGLIAGAILAMVFSSKLLLTRLKALSARIPPITILGLVGVGFWLVDVDERNVFVFSWMIALLVSSLLLSPSWLSRFLSLPAIVWAGKRSYAMYLIQGFAIEFLLLFFKPKSAGGEVLLTAGAFLVALTGAAVLHTCVEEPARKFGKRLVAYREQRTFQRKVRSTQVVVQTQAESN